MPELRKDPVTGRWVIVAVERSKRPSQYGKIEEERLGGFCPFCPGNEGSTPAEILSYRASNTLRDQEGWWLRVVPNKFPVLQPDGEIKRSAAGMYDRMTGIGDHEVLIESTHHMHSYGDLPEDQIEEILWALRERSLELRKDPRLKSIVIFKNWGREAGASLEHPHTQIIALPIVPKRVVEEVTGAQKYFEYKERCVFCDMITQETQERSRVVAENDSFIAFTPFASSFPFEMCLAPKEHSWFFHDLNKTGVADLAKIMKHIFLVLKVALDDPAYNFIIHQAPLSEVGSVPHFHWHMEIIPKLTRVAGFEWGTGFYVNPTPPEDAAKFFRETERKLAERESLNGSMVTVAT